MNMTPLKLAIVKICFLALVSCASTNSFKDYSLGLDLKTNIIPNKKQELIENALIYNGFHATHAIIRILKEGRGENRIYAGKLIRKYAPLFEYNVRDLIPSIADENEDVRNNIHQAIKIIGPASITALLSKIPEEDIKNRDMEIELLAEIIEQQKNRDISEKLVEVIKSDEYINNPENVMIGLLTGNDRELANFSVEYWFNKKSLSKKEIRQFYLLLKQNNKWSIVDAIRIVSKYSSEDPEFYNYLRANLIDHRSRYVRNAVYSAFINHEMGGSVIDQLSEEIASPNEYERMLTLNTIMSSQSDYTWLPVELMKKWIMDDSLSSDEKAIIATMIAKKVKQLGTYKKIIDDMLDKGDSYMEFRQDIIMRLSDVRSGDVLQLLKERMDDPRDEISLAAFIGYAKLENINGDLIADVLRKYMMHQNSSVANFAIKQLAEYGNKDTTIIRDLIEKLRNNIETEASIKANRKNTLFIIDAIKTIQKI